MTQPAFDVAVVGLGGMGSAALYHLASRGARVIGLEQFDIAHAQGSSHGRTRVIRSAYSEDERYVPLVRRAFELWRRLESDVERELLVMTGAVHIGRPTDPQVAGALAAAKLHGLPHSRLSADDIRQRWPVMTPNNDQVGVLEHEAGFVAVEDCVTAHVELALTAGAAVRCLTEVVQIRRAGSGVELTTAAGDTIHAGHAIVCAGAWHSAGHPLAPGWPLEVERQVQLWFAPPEPQAFALGEFPVFVQAMDGGAFYGFPTWRHPGVKVCAHHGGAVTTPATIDRTVGDDDVDAVRAFLSAHLPGASGAVLGARVCMYTNTPDGHFAIGPHPRIEHVTIAAGFSGHGFKFSPVIGEILADLADSGTTAHPIELFDPARL